MSMMPTGDSVIHTITKHEKSLCLTLNTSFISIHSQMVCYEMFSNSQNLNSLSAAHTLGGGTQKFPELLKKFN